MNTIILKRTKACCNALVFGMLLSILPATAWSATATINPSQDNTISGTLPDNSSGACDSIFSGTTDEDVILPLVPYRRALLQFEICGELDLVRVGTALHEALVNAREHGNLELSSTLREQDDGSYHKLVKQRSEELPFRERAVHVQAHFTREQATISIRDEGPGFDPADLPDPTDPENLARASGRGLFLIRTFMDHVTFNERGNEITMIKRRTP